MTLSNRILVWAVNLGAVCLAVFGGWVLYQVISDAEEETVAVAAGEPVTAANRSDDVSAAVGARSAGGIGTSVLSVGTLPTLAPSEFTPHHPDADSTNTGAHSDARRG